MINYKLTLSTGTQKMVDVDGKINRKTRKKTMMIDGKNQAFHADFPIGGILWRLGTPQLLRCPAVTGPAVTAGAAPSRHAAHPKDFAGEPAERVLGSDLRRAPLHWVLPNEMLGAMVRHGKDTVDDG